MARAIDVAAYVLDQLSSVSTMKLQKLVFYSQALHLARYGSTLFPERIEAWANGPVVPVLFNAHRGKFVISRGFLDGVGPCSLSAREASVVDHVVRQLGSLTGAALSELTHSETPWQAAREGLPPAAISNREITRESILSFYRSPSCHNPAFC